MKDKEILLKATNIKQYYPLKKTSLFQQKPVYVKANDGITLDIYQGETLGLVGESGCGKSTFGRVLLKLCPQTDGTIQYYGRSRQEFCPHYVSKETANGLQGNSIDLSLLNSSEMRLLRKDLQMIFQDPYSSLNPRMTAGQIIGDCLIEHRLYRRNSKELLLFVRQIMEECGLAPYIMDQYPHQLSGGQCQRIGIARALALRPKFIVCDEAVSALDVSIQLQILNLLQDLKKQTGLTYLFISHNLSVVKYVSDRIGVMYLGNIVELASTRELFTTPCHPYTKALLAAIPAMDKPSIPAKLLKGDIPSPITPPAGCKFHTRCPYTTAICSTVPPDFEEIEPDHFVACHNKHAFCHSERSNQ